MFDVDSLRKALDMSLDAFVIADFIVPEGSSLPSDFTALYINDAMRVILESQNIAITEKMLFSDTPFASSGIRWIPMIQSVYLSGVPCNDDIYSALLHCYFTVKIYKISPMRFCICLSDTTRIQRTEARLEYLAYNDVLTGLPNKNKLMNDIEEFLQAASLNNTCLGAMFISFENLKKICDSRGHETGDELIRKVAEKLLRFNIHKLPCYRFSSDMFLCLAKDVSGYDEMLNISDSVMETLQNSYALGNMIYEIHFNAGIALFPYDAQNSTDLLKYADTALDHSLHAGTNQVVFFQHVMHEKLLRRMLLEKSLTSAIETFNFELNYQPQFSSLTGELRGFEALLRWKDPVIGQISPEVFIPVAEETGEIVPLGEWVLRTSCATCRSWIDTYGFTGILSVNVSPVQLKTVEFLDMLHTVLDETKMPAHQLEIEITEGALIDDFSDMVKKLDAVKALGIKIALDDFGTGYSSLCYLQQLPLTTLKLDKSFVFNIQNDSNNQLEEKIADAIITLASNLGLHTIAEGVETSFQQEFLAKINCDLIQGFLTGRPMSTEQCQNLLQRLSSR